MGTYRIEIQAAGNHGCQRNKTDTQVVGFCGDTRCPDCQARMFTRILEACGSNVEHAVLRHWPGMAEEVTDNLKTGVRSGHF